MKRLTLSRIGVLTLLGLGLLVSSVSADQNRLLNAVVSFGAGLNTEGRTNSLNHLIIPVIHDEIKIKKDGVVHFSMGGFHQVFVYKANSETEFEDI